MSTDGRSWYHSDLSSFLTERVDTVIGALTRNSPLTVTPAQASAWQDEVVLLQSALAGLSGHLFLEFVIPRMGRRIDAVVISEPDDHPAAGDERDLRVLSRRPRALLRDQHLSLDRPAVEHQPPHRRVGQESEGGGVAFKKFLRAPKPRLSLSG